MTVCWPRIWSPLLPPRWAAISVYPYEAAKLEYYRVGDLNSTVSGTVISSNLVDYLAVTPGQVLVRIDGEDSETEIFTAQQNLAEAQKKLEALRRIWISAMPWRPFPVRSSA